MKKEISYLETLKAIDECKKHYIPNFCFAINKYIIVTVIWTKAIATIKLKDI